MKTSSNIRSFFDATPVLCVWVACFFCFLPFISVVPMTTDTQPLAIISVLFYFFLFFVSRIEKKQNIYFTPRLFFLFGIFFYSILISFYQNSVGVRSLFSYFSLFIFAAFSYQITRQRINFVPVVLACFFVWFFVGLMQIYFDKEFATFLLSRSTTSLSRGVTSLSGEPSHYGMYVMFLWALILMFWINKQISKTWVVVVSLCTLLQVLVLSQSALAILSFFILLGAVCLYRLPWRYKFLVVALGFGIVTAAIYFFPEKRAVSILTMIFSNPILTIKTDDSVNHRLVDIVFSFYGFFRDLPLAIGNGTFAWAGFIKKHILDLGIFREIQAGDRIMSAFGGALFELGFTGAFLAIIFIVPFWKTRSWTIFAVGTFMMVILFSALSFSWPMVGFLFGVAEAMSVEMHMRRPDVQHQVLSHEVINVT